MRARPFCVTIIGGGPAGLAPLLAAHRQGRLAELMERGIALVEQSPHLGRGEIGTYAINSDSTGTTFADCLTSGVATPLTALRQHPAARAMAAAADGPVPLSLAGEFMHEVGATIGAMLAAHPNCAVLTGWRAISVQPQAALWNTVIADADGNTRTLQSHTVISATGATQPAARLAAEQVGGITLSATYGDKLLQSGDVFAQGGLQRVTEKLAALADPRIAIIGGSTSAAALANGLLTRLPGVEFQPGGITLLHRRELRIYYETAAAALADGYTEFAEQDICPVSQRVFRFAGFRLESRELIMRARGIGGRTPEPRLRLHRLHQHDPEARAILDRADLVIAALGYRPRGIAVLTEQGDTVRLHAERTPQSPLVDGMCRIMDWDGAPIPGLYGIGLAAGFVPHGPLGGEPSFVGQANGLWLWQNDVGLLIVEAVLAAVAVTHLRATLAPEAEPPAEAPPTPDWCAELAAAGAVLADASVRAQLQASLASVP